ncbi:hypothetical protein Psch_04033 [Pelotomaculum schinkii]|uniref:Antitoxin SocA-like Panacea domain-containing protein n=1 Tax=Pelotomaculum schinkii TaxID=78350 RepID=A0A4Y7R626_9FIRM|nr:hypothetical protein [Pelotomaculum schinkii]TEB04307.1 hypothetical protein Psch_04033 [Pelotomaculum schinkii]
MEAKTFAAFLVDSLGQIKGKKAFQKFVYLAKAHGISINHAYKMHYYGPYSETLAEEFDDIYREDVVDLKKQNDYIYVKGSKTKEALTQGQEEIKDHQAPLELLLQRFGHMTPRELEIYSTTHFVWRIQLIFKRPTDRNTIIEETKKAKFPKFNIHEIERAYDDLVEWGLINSK